MKHDDTNLGSEHADETPAGAPLAAELEARVVAWVAGEASAEEAAALETLAAGNPAVAEFRNRIAATQELVTEAARVEAEPLRLAPERRARLLRTIGGAEADAAENVRPLRERIATLPKPPAWWSWRAPHLYFVSSGLAAACLVGLLLYRNHLPELYEAKATLQFEKPSAVVNVQGVTDGAMRSDADLNTNLQILEQMAKANNEFSRLAQSNDPELQRKIAAAQSGARAVPMMPSPAPVRGLDDLVAGAAPGAKEREAVASVSLAMPLASAPVPPVSPPAQAPMAMLPAPSGVGLLLSTLPPPGAESPRVAAVDAPLKLEPFVVNEERAGFAAATSSALAGRANARPVPGLDGASVTAGKELQTSLASSGAITFNFGASNPPVTTTGTGITLGAPAAMSGEKKAEQPFADTANSAEAAGTGFSPAPAVARDDVVRLEAFTVSAPPKTKILGTIGRAFSSFLTPAAPAAIGETSTAQQPISTFSLHVSDVSFRLATAAVAAMARGESVPAPKVRAEEFYNAFDYGDPAPTAAETIAARIEQSAHPFLQQRNFVRIAMKVAATGRAAGQPLRLTVLLDTSGSMEREDRAAAVRRALEVLISLLGPDDRLTLIGFARQPRLLAENLPGDRAREALAILARTPAEGGTNIEAALTLGGELARRQLTAGAQNRIVVLTDGAANLGDAQPARLLAAVETLRQQGIAFDACGVGLEGIGDTVLEALTRKGNGRYYALASAETADAAFARQLAGAFRPAAENVKLQVRFNPARVGRYRLIGFEEHRLKTEDFRNDAVDAAELAAGEAAVALYQVEVLPQGAGELGEVFVRFRDAATGGMVERSWSMPFEERVPAFEKAAPSLRLAGVAALLAEKFLETPTAEQFKLGDLAGPVGALRREYAQEPRVQELVTMFDQVRRLTRE